MQTVRKIAIRFGQERIGSCENHSASRAECPQKMGSREDLTTIRSGRREKGKLLGRLRFALGQGGKPSVRLHIRGKKGLLYMNSIAVIRK